MKSLKKLVLSVVCLVLPMLLGLATEVKAAEFQPLYDPNVNRYIWYKVDGDTLIIQSRYDNSLILKGNQIIKDAIDKTEETRAATKLAFDYEDPNCAFHVLNASNMFNNYNSAFANLTEIDISKLDTSRCTNMEFMFSECTSLKKVNLSGIDTGNVTDMGGMFSGCTGLESIDLSGLNTGKVVSTDEMFSECESLKEIDLSMLDLSSLEDASSMFNCCTSLKTINMSGMNFEKLGNLSAMFCSCSSLTSLDLSGADMPNVKMLMTVFGRCSSLKTLDLSCLDTRDCRLFYGAFYECPILETIIVSPEKWSTAKSGDYSIFGEMTEEEKRLIEAEGLVYPMFHNCISLKGGAGTVFDKNHTDIKYARIDGGPSNPGYLTASKKPDPEPDPTQIDPTKIFKDVYPKKWYSEVGGPISYVVANGIMKGTGTGDTFEPEGDCTREMFVTIIYNAEKRPGAGPSNPFTDVPNGKWYTDPITWAVSKGITSGTSATTFGLNGNVTREQMAKFLMNYASMRGYDLTGRANLGSYPDKNKISSWAVDAMSWANANGIINGKGKNGSILLDPKAKATRAEVAKMIMSFQQKFGK